MAENPLHSMIPDSRVGVPTHEASSGMLLADRYLLQRMVGHGGMGQVWLAQDTILGGRPVAVKLLLISWATDPQSVEEFVGEARFLATLTHPNICQLYTTGTHRGVPFLVMEYIQGLTLDKWLDQVKQQTGFRRLGEKQLLLLARQLAAALDYSHSQRVIHRDIAPSNVAVTPQGECKLLDFGIARQVKEGTRHVRDAQKAGKLLYMSPEQYWGAPLTVETDVYSLAATLYECLSGWPPFHEGDVVAQILNAEPPWIEGVSRRTNQALRQGLAKTAPERPQSAGELVALMEGRVSRATGAGAAGAAASARLRAFKVSRSAIFLGMAISMGLGLAVLCVISALKIAFRQPLDPTRPIVLSTQPTTQQARRGPTSAGTNDVANTRPVGSPQTHTNQMAGIWNNPSTRSSFRDGYPDSQTRPTRWPPISASRPAFPATRLALPNPVRHAAIEARNAALAARERAINAGAAWHGGTNWIHAETYLGQADDALRLGRPDALKIAENQWDSAKGRYESAEIAARNEAPALRVDQQTQARTALEAMRDAAERRYGLALDHQRHVPDAPNAYSDGLKALKAGDFAKAAQEFQRAKNLYEMTTGAPASRPG